MCHDSSLLLNSTSLWVQQIGYGPGFGVQLYVSLSRFFLQWFTTEDDNLLFQRSFVVNFRHVVLSQCLSSPPPPRGTTRAVCQKQFSSIWQTCVPSQHRENVTLADVIASNFSCLATENQVMPPLKRNVGEKRNARLVLFHSTTSQGKKRFWRFDILRADRLPCWVFFFKLTLTLVCTGFTKTGHAEN